MTCKKAARIVAHVTNKVATKKTNKKRHTDTTISEHDNWRQKSLTTWASIESCSMHGVVWKKQTDFQNVLIKLIITVPSFCLRDTLYICTSALPF